MEHLIEGYRIYREKRWPELQSLHKVLYQNCKRGTGGTCRIPLTIWEHLPLAQSPSRLKSLSVRSTTTS